MTDAAQFFSGYLPTFILVLIRSSVFMGFMPFFGSKSVSPKIKLWFIISLALVLTPVIDFRIPETVIPLYLIREIVMGLILGLTMRFVFLAVDMAGQLMSNAIGLSIASTFNPEMGQSTDIAQFFQIAAMFTFLGIDAHHDLIYVFAKSYEWLPGGQVSVAGLLPEIISMGSRLFVIALKISAPILLVILITNIILGFINKAVPQMNVFFIGFSVYILAGFIVIMLIMPVFTRLVGELFGNLGEDYLRVLTTAKG